MKKLQEASDENDLPVDDLCNRSNDNCLLICTWNVWTLNKNGDEDKKLVKVLDNFKADITAVQEVRWHGPGTKNLDTCDIYYGDCNRASRAFGCGFVISGELRKKVLHFKAISERLVVIRIKTDFANISFICAHAPTIYKDDVTKDVFYDLLDQTYGNCPKGDLKITLGDFNAKIGKEGIFGSTAGHDSLHEITSENGYRLIDFAASRKLIIISTLFPRENKYKKTWRHPKGNLNQVDHIVIDAKYSSIILDVRTISEAKFHSDHYLVAAKVDLKKLLPSEISRRSVEKYNNEQQLFEDLVLTRSSKKSQPRTNCKLKKEDSAHLADDIIHYPPPNQNEVEIAICKLKCNKNIEGLVTKLCKPEAPLVRIIHAIVCKMWSDESLCLQLIKDIQNSTSSTILCKIFSLVLCEQLKPFAKQSRINQVFTLRQILEQTREYNVNTHHLFLEFKYDYDSLSINDLYSAISNFGVPAKLVGFWKMIVDSTRSTFNIGFHIILEIILQNLQMYSNSTIFQNSVQILTYGDGIDVIGRTQKVVKEAFLKIKAEAAKLGLVINESNTKYMLSKRKDILPSEFKKTIEIGGYNFEQVRNFVFADFAISSIKGTSAEIMRKLTLSNRCYFSLRSKFESEIPSTDKKNLYRNYLIPFLLDGAEVWMLSKDDKIMLAYFERKMLRIIFARDVVDGAKNIDALYNLYGDIDIISKIQMKRLRWLKDVQQMDKQDPVRIVFESIPVKGKRSPGSPPSKWIKEVRADIDQASKNLVLRKLFKEYI